MSKIIEYKNNFHLGYNDTSREQFIKFLNDEQDINAAQIVKINAHTIGKEQYMLDSIEFETTDMIKKIYGITGTYRSNVKIIKIVDGWFALEANLPL